MIYLDYSATTPVSLEVLDTMNKVTKEYIGNANSINGLGIKSAALLEASIKQIADTLGINEQEITFTSSSTESNNIALIGYAMAHYKEGKHIIVSKLEHASIYSICDYLKSIGFEISYVKNMDNGLIDFEDLKSLIRKDTILVSICAVNSELGIRQPLKMIRQTIKKENNATVFHSDMTQAIGKTPVNLHDVDLASISSHKIFGPKGIAMLYVNSQVKINPLVYGSGKTNSLKPGTPALPLIVGFSKAIRIAMEGIEKKEKYIYLLNRRISSKISTYPGVLINSTPYSIPHILNVSFISVKPETFVHALDQEEIYISTNTACSSGDISNAVLAVYNDVQRAGHTIRISLSHVTTGEEVTKFIEKFTEIYSRLSKLTVGDNEKGNNN